MKYRLIYANTGVPCSDWSEDAEHFHRYLADRPDWVQKIIVVNNEGNPVEPYKEWTGLKDFVAGINTDRLVVDEGIHVSLTPEDMKTLDEGMAHMEAQIDAAEKEGKVLVLNANGKPMFVPKEEAYLYNGNDDEGLAVFGLPPDATADDINNLLDPLVPYYDGGREFLIRKSEADDFERFDEFEAAADCADEMDKLNNTLPNDEPLVGFIEKEPKCPFGHSPRGTTFGGDALHHSCGCPVLKGEEIV